MATNTATIPLNKNVADAPKVNQIKPAAELAINVAIL